ncbi:16S rRNA (cytidine(1402)-2'-O)-methyltransferase [Luteibacter sp. 22Crub2.1]|jgi:16S rRNA (cytidine1402-2'-O)-methyltransferase|uniref:16S rRNA (cytidine(1402)-2'-O)-methyltransferase n=1 Tax=Luteibacter sp. 22Crub2.1 TaxID=1283288 RepID=UPI0009A79812|nr:16S rRNA (cytidine(1402)-2'-O)-methyltransferase [Luteibacter sp. 22Crub2.1]SKB32055.1 16S rRNA (cytidine1402-2'-O)-methyltransferase [Luteibacter sp. 22Crub2.1]
MSQPRPGTLHVVATPIGHRDDISARAIETLRRARVIAAEDTRHTRPLLQHLNIDTPLVALHDHNERTAVDGLVERMRGGDDVALVSDAGTPLISDPGFRLVRAARIAGLRVSPVPGPSAVIAALSVAGLPSDRFVFEGFLSAKAGARRSRLAELAGESRTLIFYESSHRIVESLEDMREAFGADREAVVARELTKMFETVLGDPLSALVERVSADPNQQKGEFVVMVAGREAGEDERLSEGLRVFAILKDELPPARAAKLAAAITGAPRKALYGA